MNQSQRIDWEDIASSINPRNRLNNDNNTSSTPQQTVVNGWITNDWLMLISDP